MSFESIVIVAVVGLLAGWLAGFVMKGGGYGLVGVSRWVWSEASWGASCSGRLGSRRPGAVSRRSASRSSARSS